jgi:hypothetical protein
VGERISLVMLRGVESQLLVAGNSSPHCPLNSVALHRFSGS